MIEIFFGRFESTTRSARRWRQLRCDDCGDSYVYEQTLTAGGYGWNAFHVRTWQAAIAAREMAEQKLQAKLAGDAHDAICCPSCGAYPAALKEAATNAVVSLWTERLQNLNVAVMSIAGLIAILMIAKYLPSSYWVIFSTLMLMALIPAFAHVAMPYVAGRYFQPRDINAPGLKASRAASRRPSVISRRKFEIMFSQLTPEERESLLLQADVEAKAKVPEYSSV